MLSVGLFLPGRISRIFCASHGGHVHKKESHFKYDEGNSPLVLDSALLLLATLKKKENKYGVHKIPWALERERQQTAEVYIPSIP